MAVWGPGGGWARQGGSRTNYRGYGAQDGVLTEVGAVGDSDGPGTEQA